MASVTNPEVHRKPFLVALGTTLIGIGGVFACCLVVDLLAEHDDTPDMLAMSLASVIAIACTIWWSTASMSRLVQSRDLAVGECEQAEKQNQALVDALPHGAVVIDANDCIVMVNLWCEQFFHYSREELLGQRMEMLLSQRCRSEYSAFRRSTSSTIEERVRTERAEFCGRQKNGREVAVELALRPMQSSKRVHTLVSIMDIADRKRLEEKARLALRSSSKSIPMIDSVGHVFVLSAETEKAKRQAEKALQERMTLACWSADISLALTGNGTLQQMLQTCAETMVRHLGAAFARIWTLNEGDNVLELRASAGQYTHTDGPHSRVEVGKLKIGLIAQERRPHLSNDILNDSGLGDPEWAQREGFVAFAGFPLLVDGRLVGVMALFSRHQLTQATLDAMGAVANHIALGILRKKAEGRLEYVVSSSPAILCTLAIAGTELKPTWISDNVRALLGYSVEDVFLSNWWQEHIHAQDRGRVLAEIEQRLFTSDHVASEYLFQHQRGHYLWVRCEMRLLRDAAGNPVEVVGSWSDITGNKRTEAERNQFLQRLELQIDRMPLAYILFDADLRVIDWNASAKRIFGYDKNEVLGMPPPFEKITPTAFRQQAEETLERVRSGDMSAHSVQTNLTKEGRTITCEWSNTPLFTDDGQFSGMMSLAQDISHRISLEEQCRQSQKMEAIGKLAGGVAHDFNNLLTVINGYSGIMLESLRPADPFYDLVKQIQHSGDRAAGLTRQLLAFSRKQILQPAILNVDKLIAEMQKMLGRLIGEDIAMAVRAPQDLWLVKADAGQIEQVVMNLVVNARDAMPKGGRLTIEMENIHLSDKHLIAHPEAHAGEHALIRVSDTGCGMDSATLTRIFEPFFTTKADKGTGLGLATVFGIIKQSGGHIEVESTVGQGSVFKVYLPREQQGKESSQCQSGCGRSLRGNETVLLVEDEEGVRVLARLVLKKLGYNLLVARHGREALILCEHHEGPIHLMVTDVVMPDMSGRDLAGRLHQLRPDMKILYISGYTDDAVVRHGILDTRTPFLQKPFTPNALAKKVREVLEGSLSNSHLIPQECQ